MYEEQLVSWGSLSQGHPRTIRRRFKGSGQDHRLQKISERNKELWERLERRLSSCKHLPLSKVLRFNSQHQHISSKPSTTPAARRHHHVHSTQNTHSGPHTYTQNEIKGTMERTMVRDGREPWSATAVEKLQSEYWRGSKRLPKVTGSLRLPNTSSSGL